MEQIKLKVSPKLFSTRMGISISPKTVLRRQSVSISIYLSLVNKTFSFQYKFQFQTTFRQLFEIVCSVNNYL